VPVVAWRLATRREPRAAFDGEGARLYGGRWNRPGTPLVYAAEHLSLAVLETFVHLDPEDEPRALFRFRLKLPESAVERLPPARVPASWRNYPAPDETAEIGSDWARKNEALALMVPSAIVPEESNILVNPAHPAFRQLLLERGERFSFDGRMWKKVAREQ
jgi:RES domain-containing protein